MAAIPASSKPRKTKVARSWFYDPNREKWRFAPSDTTHQAQRVMKDRVTGVTETVRPVEAKGWLPAAQAVNLVPGCLKTAPEHIREMFGKDEAEQKAS